MFTAMNSGDKLNLFCSLNMMPIFIYCYIIHICIYGYDEDFLLLHYHN